jgi:adenylate cyclase
MKVTNKLCVLLCIISVFHGRSILAQDASRHLVDSLLLSVKDLPNDTAKVDTLSSLAYDMHLHDPIAGLQLAKLVYRLADSLHYEIGRLRAELYWGLNYYSLTEYPEALQHTLAALEIGKGLGPERTAVCYNNLGIIYRESGDLENAERNFRKALAIDEELGLPGGTAKRWWNLAAVAQRRDSLHKALNYFQRALDMERKANGNTGMVIATLGYIASIQAQPGMEPLAGVRSAKEALGLRAEVNETFAEADAWSTLGRLYLLIARNEDQGPVDELFDGDRKAAMEAALAATDSAIGLVQAGNLEINKFYYYKQRSDVLQELGLADRALTDHKRFALLKDSALTLEKDKRFTRKAMQYEYELKDAEARAEQEKKDAKSRMIRNGIGLGLLGSLFFLVIVWRQRNKIGKEKERSEELLLNILPEEVAEELKEKGHSDAQLIDEVTILFTDFKGFTSLSEKVTPKELVADLHECFTAFDNICDKYGIEKIKTIGDAYMAAGGLPTPNITHATDVINAALEMRDFVESGKAKKIKAEHPYFEIRIGVHTGPVVAGIVGVKKFQYDIWGDTVNTASRMESSSEVGKVNISESTYELLKEDTHFSFESRGKIEAKGKGEIEMYFVSKSKRK